MAQAIDLGPIDEGIDLGPIDLGEAPKQEGILENAKGGLAAAGNFFNQMIGIPAAGIYGLGKGALGAAQGKDFLSSATEGIDEANKFFDVGRITGMSDNPGYQAASDVLAYPAEMGVKSLRGLGALSTAATQGVDKAVYGLEHPEATPLTSTAQDVLGPVLGYGIAGKFGSEAKQRIKEARKPHIPEKVEFIDLGPVEEKPSRLVPPEEVFQDVFEEGKINPYENREGLFPGEDLKRQQLDEDARAADFQARYDEFGERQPQPEKPLQYSLSLEDNPPREELRQADNDRIYNTRGEFPTIDIGLLPDRVSADTVITGLITRYNNAHAKLRELYQKANEVGLQGTQLRSQKLGMTKKAGKEITAMQEEVAKSEALLNNLAKQLQKRMEVKHNFVYDEGWEGAPLYSGAEKGKAGIYSEEPPSVEGIPERTTGLTVEKTEPPNMQRSPDAKITNTAKIQKTTRHPLGGVGKKQGGAIDPELLKSMAKLSLTALDKIAKTIKIAHNTAKYKEKDLEKVERLQENLTQVHQLMSDKIEENTGSETRRKREEKTTLLNDKYKGKYITYKRSNGEVERAKVESAFYEPHSARTHLLSIKIEGLEDAKTSISPDRVVSVFNGPSGLNKGPGGKQSGGYRPDVFTEGIAKLLGKGKTPKTPKYEPKGLTAKLASMGPTDPRDVNKFVEDVLPQASTFKDLNIGQRAISHAINPDNVANIVAKRTNPIISFVNSKLNDIDRMIRNEKQNATHGEAFKPGIRGWEKRVAGDDGAITLYEKAPKVSQEKIRKVAREWQDKGDQLEAMGLKYATDDMYRASGLSDAEIKALRAMESQTTKLFDRANAIIKKVNPDAKPIEHKAGYVPDIWEGDYRVFVRDKDGNAIHVGSAPTWYHAKFLEKKLKEKFPDHDINTKTVEESKYALNDTSAFAMVHNLLGDTKEGKIIAKYEAEVKAHRGYKRHGLHKKGAQGALGSAVGDTKGFAKAREMYLNSGYEFIGDMERQLLERDLQRAFEEKGYDLNKQLPETSKYIRTLVANSKGAIENHLKLIDHALEGVGKGVGLGPNAGRNILGLLNSAASTAWLSSFKFMELNALQPLVGMGKATEVQLALGGDNVPGAFSKALLATYIPGMASAEQKAAMSFAKRNGHIDAKFVDAFGVGPMTHDWAKRAVDTLPKHILGVIEQEMVRTPMFLTFNDILKNVIKDPKERWHAAGALTEYTMTNYSRTQALPFWQRAGFVGDAVKPMKAFAINATGQLMDLTHAAVVGKSAKTTVPLLVSLGVAWGLSGVQGSAPAQLADNMIDLINSVLSADNQLPNVEELLIGSGMKDEYIFGMVSKYTGQNLSGSLAFPDIASMGSAPGLQYGKNILTEGGGYLLKDMQGKATEADKMKAALAVAPAQGREVVKEKFTRPGHGVPDPKNEMHSRLPPRDEGTSLQAMITAAEPESEHIQKAHIRAYDNAKKREGSGRAVWKTKLINDFIHEGQLNQEALDMFVEKGGDPRNLSTSVKKWMVDDILSFYAQEMVKNKGISLVHAMERLEKFRVMLEGQEPKDLADDWQQSQ